MDEDEDGEDAPEDEPDQDAASDETDKFAAVMFRRMAGVAHGT